jgi:hypothetical protein
MKNGQRRTNVKYRVMPRTCRTCKETYMMTADEIYQHQQDHFRLIQRSGMGQIVVPKLILPNGGKN